MTVYTVMPATVEDALVIAANMRAEDVAEIAALEGWTPEEALLYSMDMSREATTAFADETPICMYGIAQPTFLSDMAVPWLLTTEDLPRHWMHFLRGSQMWIADVRQKYPLLVNYVDARYGVALKWLRWLGFEIGEPGPYGSRGNLFCRAELRS